MSFLVQGFRGAFAAIVFALAISGYATASEPLSKPADIEEIYKKAMATSDASLIGPYYAPDAKLFMPDGSVLEGRDAIQADLQKGYDTSERSLDESHIQVMGDDSNAVLVWDWKLRIVERGHANILKGRSLHVWRKTDDGWQIHQDIFQTF